MFDPMMYLLLSVQTTGLIAMVIGGALLCVAILVLWWNQHRSIGAAGLRLAKRMGLDRRQRHVVATWARDAGGLDMAAILISEGCFDHVAEVYGGHVDPVEVLELRSRLFESSP